jgi:hypothetical protein
VADDFSERYGDLLTGSYDCVDRIVLNAFFPLGHNPGGFGTWWRRMHDGSDDLLDDTHLMRFAGRFARRLKAWAGANGVLVIYCKAPGPGQLGLATGLLLGVPPHPGAQVLNARRQRRGHRPGVCASHPLEQKRPGAQLFVRVVPHRKSAWPAPDSPRNWS